MASRRCCTPQKATGTTTGVFDQAFMYFAHGRLDAADQPELFAGRKERSDLRKQACRVNAARCRGLRDAVHRILTQCKQRPCRSGGVSPVGHQSGANGAKEISAQLVHG
jgi:hypothetical protein